VVIPQMAYKYLCLNNYLVLVLTLYSSLV